MHRTVLVTGASSGIGEAICLELARRDWQVYAAARRVERMRPLADAGVRILPLDVTSEEAIKDAIDRVMVESGRLDGLVNNAGFGAYGSFEEMPLAEGRSQFEVNVFGLARLTQLAIPIMRQQRSGRIINISSIGGRIHEPMGSWYHASKFALEGLSDCLRMELAPFGIDVVVIQPGAIKTEWSGIAQAALIKHSSSGPYADQASLTLGLLRGADNTSSSPPSVVASAVGRALEVKRPQTRYLVGGGAHLMIGLRRLLTDRAFDSAMRMASRLMQKG